MLLWFRFCLQITAVLKLWFKSGLFANFVGRNSVEDSMNQGVRLSLLSLLGLGMTDFSFFGTDFTDYAVFLSVHRGQADKSFGSFRLNQAKSS